MTAGGVPPDYQLRALEQEALTGERTLLCDQSEGGQVGLDRAISGPGASSPFGNKGKSRRLVADRQTQEQGEEGQEARAHDR